MQVRLDKYGNSPERDAKHTESIAQLTKRLDERMEKQRKAGVRRPAARGIPLAPGGAARVALRAGAEDAVSGVLQAAGEDLERDPVVRHHFANPRSTSTAFVAA